MDPNAYAHLLYGHAGVLALAPAPRREHFPEVVAQVVALAEAAGRDADEPHALRVHSKVRGRRLDALLQCPRRRAPLVLQGASSHQVTRCSLEADIEPHPRLAHVARNHISV